MLLSFSWNTVVSLSWDCWSLCCISRGCSIDQSEHQSHWHFWPVRAITDQTMTTPGWLQLGRLLWADRIFIRPKASSWVATGLFTIVPWDESVQLTLCNLLPPSVQQHQGATLFQRTLCCVCYMILVIFMFIVLVIIERYCKKEQFISLTELIITTQKQSLKSTNIDLNCLSLHFTLPYSLTNLIFSFFLRFSHTHRHKKNFA